jgi:pyrroline-5-carboxylate reductase
MTQHLLPPLGFVGAGRMATALVQGLLRAGLSIKDRVLATDALEAARTQFTQATGVQAVADNRLAVEQREIVILAVKPQTMPTVLAELRPLVTPRQLVISIAAGITLRQLADGLGPDRRIVRVMPNTPCLVGAGATGFSMGPGTTEADRAVVERIFNAVGTAFYLPERLLDAVTGLSGSGPAYVAVIIEALADGGVNAGLPRDVATALAAQTVLGAARMIVETGQHPAALKDAVASPGGTTIAGLQALERGGLRAALMDAVAAATQRAVELGKGSG